PPGAGSEGEDLGVAGSPCPLAHPVSPPAAIKASPTINTVARAAEIEKVFSGVRGTWVSGCVRTSSMDPNDSFGAGDQQPRSGHAHHTTSGEGVKSLLYPLVAALLDETLMAILASCSAESPG
ncbi:MAG: hypothetical protein ABIW32_05840, partial [Terrimesophilobacter sp.]